MSWLSSFKRYINVLNTILTQTTVFLEEKERTKPRVLGKNMLFSQSLCPSHSPLSSNQTQWQHSWRWKRNVWFCINVLGLCINLIPLEGKGSADPAAAPHLTGSPCPTAFSLLLPSHQHGHDQCNKEGGEGAMIYLEDLLKYLKEHGRE